MAGDTIILGNWNDTTPAAPAGYDNIKFGKDTSNPPNIAAAVPRADVAGTKYGTVLFDGNNSATRYLGSDGNWHDVPSAIPAGGLLGQLLSVTSESPYEVGWVDAPLAANGIPNGGTDGQVLAKASNDSGDVEWIDQAASSGGALVFIEEKTANSSAQLDFSLSSSYDRFRAEFISVIPATNSTPLQCRVSTDGGTSFDTGNNYARNVHYYWGGTHDKYNGDSESKLFESGEISSNATYGGISGFAEFFNPANTAGYKIAIGKLYGYNTVQSNFSQNDVQGVYKSTSAVNAIRFVMASGNIASGKIRLYGLKNS